MANVYADISKTIRMLIFLEICMNPCSASKIIVQRTVQIGFKVDLCGDISSCECALLLAVQYELYERWLISHYIP